MRIYIFRFKQDVALKLNLNLKQLLLLDYIYRFFKYENAKVIESDGKRYLKLSYNKILNDLPLLDVSARQLRNIICDLVSKNVAERFSGKPHEIYIHINWDILEEETQPGQSVESNLSEVERELEKDRQEIVLNHRFYASYNKADTKTLQMLIHKNIKTYMSSVGYEVWFKSLRVEKVMSKKIVVSSPFAQTIKRTFLRQLKTAIYDAFSDVEQK